MEQVRIEGRSAEVAMPKLDHNADPITDPKGGVAGFLRALKESGQPIVLTINGKSELAVQDPESYQRLLDLVDRLETIASVRAGMKDIADGRSLSLEQFKDEVRKKHGLSL
jgi:hypothetical protein